MNSPPVVTSSVTGTEAIDLSYLRKAIGVTTFEVWVAFLWRRDKNGVSFASGRSISRDKSFPPASVTRACKKLERIKLIQNAEWVVSRGRRRFKRTIHGDYRNGIVTIPRETKQEVRKLPKWGGTRNKPSIGGNPQVQDGPTVNPRVVQDESRLTQDDSILKRSIKRSNIMSFGHNMCADSPHPDLLFLDPPELGEPPVQYNTDNDPTDLPTKKRQIQSEPKLLRKSEEEPFPRKSTKFYGENKTDRNVPMEIPPYPSSSYIGVAKIPAPPIIEEASSDLASVKTMLNVYRGAVEVRYGKKSYAFTRGNIQKSKYWKAFLEAATFLKENEIAPAAWAAFSIGVWGGYMNNKKPPTANWVFSCKRLEENYSWFDREASSYGGGRILFSKSHSDILRRYSGLKREMFRSELTDDLLEKWFPGGWEAFYEKAKQETASDQAQLRKLVREGKFIW